MTCDLLYTVVLLCLSVVPCFGQASTCQSAGLSPGCCTLTQGTCSTGSCYCDRLCHRLDDCCEDVPDSPQCAPCTIPADPINGTVTTTGTGTSVGDIAIYTCDEGFELMGQETATCIQNSGSASFQPTPPTCHALCSTPPNIQHGTFTFTGNSVGDTVTYTCDSGYETVDDTTLTCTEVDINNSEFVPSPPTCMPIQACLTKLYVMAFTSNVLGADAGVGHDIELRVNNEVRHIPLYNRPGDDYFPHKGDLWDINFSSFHFPFSCIKFRDIQSVYILEGINDGWNIDSIVTLVRDIHGTDQILTSNLKVFRWIDGDRTAFERRFELTFA